MILGLINALGDTKLNTENWINELNSMKTEFPLSYNQNENGPLKVPLFLKSFKI
ncbi:MAG: hypothetical protein Ct9H90mP17_1390 [Actinomycetota bacterium]|nr:MAG: hypothetical protein Ct9H90mP17_1390 [Actinomycetota bacterium]